MSSLMFALEPQFKCIFFLIKISEHIQAYQDMYFIVCANTTPFKHIDHKALSEI